MGCARKLEELLALTMSMPEEQAQELRVKAACGARDGRHQGDTMVAGIGRLILQHCLPGGLPQRPVDVIRVAEVAILGRLVGRPAALVGHQEIVDEVPPHIIVLEVALELHVSPLLALAGRYGSLTRTSWPSERKSGLS